MSAYQGNYLTRGFRVGWGSTVRTASFIYGMLAALSVAVGFPTQSHAESRIEWRLENPFRLFKRPEHTEMHRRIFESLSFAEQRSPILAAEQKLELQFGGRGWADRIFNHTCYDQNRDRYNACENYVLPKSHRIIAHLKDLGGFFSFFSDAPSPNATCSWKSVGQDGQAVSQQTVPCDRSVALEIPYPTGAQIIVTRPGSSVPLTPALNVKIRDLLIVGMGDSFAAGDGNPDHPAALSDERSHDYGYVDIAATGAREELDGYPARVGRWKDINSNAFRKQRARWWDRECHRSLYSHQLRVALQLAVENPQRSVTFVSFSCSGAEISQGLLLDLPVRECTPGEKPRVPAQFSALSEELCSSLQRDVPMPAAIISRVPELRGVSEGKMRLTRCRRLKRGGQYVPDLKRPIDLVLLSIGGNDVGFVPLISDSLLSEQSIYRVLGRQFDSVYGVDRARQRLDLLKRRFSGLRYSMDLLLGVSSDGERPGNVILTGYPNVGYGEDGMRTCGGTKGLEVFPPFHLDADKVGEAEDFTQELNSQLAALAGNGWTYVDGFRDDFRSHGLCAVNGAGPSEMLGFPRRKNGRWEPFAPSQYAPYTPRQRWFRTPNDAFLTSNMHAAQISGFGANCTGLLTGAFRGLARNHWQPFQVFLASTYGGAFHPTAEGQARMADDVVKQARKILERAETH